MKTISVVLFALLSLNVAAIAAGPSVSGTISLGPNMVAPKGAVIFIAARPVTGGPPMAVKKIADPKFPLTFSLDQENAMMGGAFAGDVEITVRASQAGDPMSRTPGDLFGTLKTKVGAAKLKVVLDHKI
jgi:hypothetical protein